MLAKINFPKYLKFVTTYLFYVALRIFFMLTKIMSALRAIVILPRVLG